MCDTQSLCHGMQTRCVCLENKIFYKAQHYFTSMVTEEKSLEMFPSVRAAKQWDSRVRNSEILFPRSCSSH